MRLRFAGWGRRRRIGNVLAVTGAVLVLAGLGVLLPPVLGVLHRGGNDKQLMHKWLGPTGAITKVIPQQAESQVNSNSPATVPACGTGSANTEYALVAFPSLPGVEGVAGNGSWAMLTQRSVVHYAASPGPGGVGNVLIALHREPNFEPLGTLKAGDQVVITARDCQQFTYTITQVWVESPAQVTQLQPIAQGHFLTLVTCTPLWVDTQRIVIRATLTAT
ncbi:MAG: class E sortase [Candidatus Dormibacteria bacterium]